MSRTNRSHSCASTYCHVDVPILRNMLTGPRTCQSSCNARTQSPALSLGPTGYLRFFVRQLAKTAHLTNCFIVDELWYMGIHNVTSSCHNFPIWTARNPRVIPYVNLWTISPTLQICPRLKVCIPAKILIVCLLADATLIICSGVLVG
jgi:hypothetical protein